MDTVATPPEPAAHPTVIDGCLDPWVDVVGEIGKPPGGIPVKTEIVARVEESWRPEYLWRENPVAGQQAR